MVETPIGVRNGAVGSIGIVALDDSPGGRPREIAEVLLLLQLIRDVDGAQGGKYTLIRH